MYLIQILLPVPARTPDQTTLSKTREELADRFGGVTAYARTPAEGIWVSPEGTKERDTMLMVEVFTEGFDRVWWKAYSKTLAERFKQEEIHIRAIHAEVP